MQGWGAPCRKTAGRGTGTRPEPGCRKAASVREPAEGAYRRPYRGGARGVNGSSARREKGKNIAADGTALKKTQERGEVQGLGTDA